MSSPHSLLDIQVKRVSRRLFFQTLLNRLIWCVSIALLVATVWFLLQPFFVEAAPSWLRWTVAGGLAGVSVIVAVVLAALAAPSQLTSALELDEKFELKERVTTSLTLRPEQAQTPAGQALLEDVNKRVGGLDVPAKFPIRLSWIASLVPVAAAVLMLVALFYQPSQTPAKPGALADRKLTKVEKAELDKTFEKMKLRKEFDPEDRPKSEKLQEIEAEMEKIANKPRDTREQVRERIKEMNQLEDKARDRQKELADKTKTMQQQLKDINQQAQKDSATKDGPGKDMQDAMSKGDFDKAKDELDKLAKKIKEGELNEKEREQLKNQLANMQKKVDDLKQKQEQKEQDLEKKIREAKEQGKDADSLERELQDLKQEGMKMQGLQDLAKKMGDAKDSLEKGDAKGAADKLQAAADELKDMNLSDKEMKDLQNQIDKLQQAKDACCKGDKEGDGEGEGEGEGKGKGKSKNGNGKGNGGQESDQNGDGFSEGRGPGQKGAANGPRPKPKEGKTNNYDARQKADFDSKGKKVFEGFAPGKNFAPKSGPEMAGDVKDAAQEAPEAIEAQRVPRGARESVKGYFRNLGGQADKDLKKQPEEKK